MAVPAPPVEEPRPEFSEFLSKIKEQAVAAGVSTATVDAALTNLEPLEIVVERDRTQAEVVLSIDQYLSRRLTRSFMRTAADKAREHREELAAIAKKYGVASSVLRGRLGHGVELRPLYRHAPDRAGARDAGLGRPAAGILHDRVDRCAPDSRQGLYRAWPDEGIVGGRDGADAVHALQLSRARAGLRRRRPPRHLDDAARRVCVDCELHDRLRVEGRSDLGSRGEGAGRAAPRSWQARLASGRADAARNAS